MSSWEEDTDPIKRHCELQWNSKIILAEATIEGTEEQKQRILNERIKKFHLYNTPQLKIHSQHQVSYSESSTDSFTVDHTIDFDAYDKTLLLMGARPSDINYLGILFKYYEVQVKNIINYQNKGLQLYFDSPFEKVEKSLTKVQAPANNRNQGEYYKLNQIQGCDLVNPLIRVKIMFQPKPGSRQYLFSCAKSRFIENQTSRIEREKSQLSRSRSRSRSRTPSIESSGARRSILNFQENVKTDDPFRQRRQMIRNRDDFKKRVESPQKIPARRSIHLQMMSSRPSMSDRSSF